MKEKIKIGYVGLGRRGMGLLKESVALMPDVELVLCEIDETKLRAAVSVVEEESGYTPAATTNYDDIITDEAIDAVMIMTPWSGRLELAKKAMLAGKHTGIEVGCADNIEECWELLDAHKKTGAKLTMLENGAFGRLAMLALNLVHSGALGEIIYSTGGYFHDLRAQDLFRAATGDDANHYRLAQYMNHNRSNYPTHELGPIMKMMKINHGNRMVRLHSFSTKSVALKEYATKYYGKDSKLAQAEYKQGDINTTLIECSNGANILITLDTTLPRGTHTKGLAIHGTRGMFDYDTESVYLDGMPRPTKGNIEDFYKTHEHPLWVEFQKAGVKGGHNGGDWLSVRSFVESVKHDIDAPFDIYDTLVLLAVGPLSEQSVAEGGVAVDIPDFTDGKWRDAEPTHRTKFCLDTTLVDEYHMHL